jgi:hypothetical protein
VVPVVSPGPGDVGFVRESPRRAEEAANVFKYHPLEEEKYGPLADHSGKPRENNEAGSGVVEYYGTPTTNETKVKAPATVSRDDRGEIEGEKGEKSVDYPSGIKLGLVTFGLCLTTFCVTLDNTVA